MGKIIFTTIFLVLLVVGYFMFFGGDDSSSDIYGDDGDDLGEDSADSYVPVSGDDEEEMIIEVDDEDEEEEDGEEEVVGECQTDNECVLKEVGYCCADQAETREDCYGVDENPPQLIDCVGETSCPGFAMISGCQCVSGECEGVIADEPEEESAPIGVEYEISAARWEFTPSVITVNQGELVKLSVVNTDTDHGISIPDYGVSGVNELEFTADQTGTFTFYCKTYCGSGHSGMTGTLIVE